MNTGNHLTRKARRAATIASMLIILSLVLPVTSVITGAAASTEPVAQSKKPNILVIWGDDIGWQNVSAYGMGTMGYTTPNIDSLGTQGSRFTDHYAQNSCTAGRAAFITGQYPIRSGLVTVGVPGDKLGLQAASPSLAEVLKKVGYNTGHFGKNHLGDRNEHLPTVHGFDEFFGNLYHLNTQEQAEYLDYQEFAKQYPGGPQAFATKFGTRAKEARAIAKDAYIYGFPLVDSYRILYSYFVDHSDPEYKAGWNEKVFNNARVFTPDDVAMQTPNSDTPYSQLGLDLRTEPMVLSVPAVEKGRYYSVEVNDLYTFISGYIGTRKTGNDAGDYMIAGPGWKGDKPDGIKGVIPCETELAFIFYRTQLFSPDDIENVKKIQAGYTVQPLSAFLGKPAPPPAPKIDFPKPISFEEEKTSLKFFNELNFVLQFCPTHPAEKELRERFARLGISGGQTFAAGSLSPETKNAIEQGMADGWQAYDESQKKMVTGELTSADLFGSREYLKGNYVYRMMGTVDGIWGNAKEEAVYPGYYADSTRKPLDGSGNRYTLRFPPNQLPPVNAFWSLTMYAMPSHLLVANPINRYLINSPMLPNMTKDADGGLTLYIQKDSPGKDKESNWLPAPDGPFIIALRMYWPKPEVLNGKWQKPPIERATR